MKNISTAIIYAIILFGFIEKSFGQSTKHIFKEPLSPRNANYDIEVKFFPSTKTLKGKETIKWTNITTKPTNELQFHLYLNGFSNDKTTIMVESEGVNREGKRFKKANSSFSKIISFRIDKIDYLNQLEFIQPDDNNENDSTVVRIKLDKPVKANETIEINLEFNAKLPQVFARTGYSDPSKTKDFFLVAQWFPKIGVLEESGWNCHQYHANTEFFSDYGVYNVTITTPKQFVIGATGELTSQVTLDSIKTITYHAEDVHDFAWTAYPDFNVYEEKYKDVAIRFLYNKESKHDIEEQIQALRYTLDFCEEYFGKYPYPNITFLNPPEGASAAGGVEFPTFFTVGRNGIFLDKQISIHLATTIHEFAHQIFYGILGTNEFENAWMDEGMTNFVTQRVIDIYYGGHINRDDFSFTSENRDRFKYLQKPNNESILTTSYKQKRSNYGINSYARPAILLRTLEKFLGEDIFKKGIRFYFDKWKFKHPKPKDFFLAMSEGSGTDLTWFFEQFFYDNKTVDYEINRISQREIITDFINHDFQHFPDVELSGKKPIFYNRVDIKNYGNGYFPMDLEVTLNDKTLWTSANWDYKLNYSYIEFYSNSPMLKAQLDPKRKVIVDLSYSNNGKSFNVENSSDKFVYRWQFWVHNIAQFLGGF